MSNFASRNLSPNELNALTRPEQFMTVEANLTFEDRIKRGNYYWAYRNVMESLFPVTVGQIGEWEWKLFHFNQNISSKEAIRLMKEDGFEPGQIGHILTFGEINPKEQLQYPIIGLGSFAMGSFPSLENRRGRELNLRQFANYWEDRFRFLGVRRRSAA